MPDAMDYSHSFLPRERTYRLRAVRVIGRVGRDRALASRALPASASAGITSLLAFKRCGRKAGRHCEFSHPVGTSMAREPRVTRAVVERQNRILLDVPLDA
jgi:hypothetical protein